MQIRRTILDALRNHLAQPEITLLIGPRQAGKTTLLKTLAAELEAAQQATLFFNLDIDTDAVHFASQQQLVNRIQAEFNQQPAYIFIDEVQRIENAGLFLKGLYDRQLPYKWVVTGSGSLEIKEKIAESLVGRKRNFYVSTVSISEFCRYKTNNRFGDALGSVLAADPGLEQQLLEEYMRFGGYPRVITAPTSAEKEAILAEIFQGYIERDIQSLLRLEKSRSFTLLLQLLATRIGSSVNYQDLAQHCGLSIPTLKDYLWYAEKTFIVEAIAPFFRNREKEIVKSPQYYFYDGGLRNFLIDGLGAPAAWDDYGMPFQQLVLQLLKMQVADKATSIHFWRTQHQAEVDFVLDSGIRQIPVEVKYTALKAAKVERSMRAFIEQYHPAEAWVIHRGAPLEEQIGGTTVYFKPWYALI